MEKRIGTNNGHLLAVGLTFNMKVKLIFHQRLHSLIALPFLLWTLYLLQTCLAELQQCQDLCSVVGFSTTKVIP